MSFFPPMWFETFPWSPPHFHAGRIAVQMNISNALPRVSPELIEPPEAPDPVSVPKTSSIEEEGESRKLIRRICRCGVKMKKGEGPALRSRESAGKQSGQKTARTTTRKTR